MLKTLIIIGLFICLFLAILFIVCKPFRKFIIDLYQKNKELADYIIVGCMTTVVSFVTLYIFHSLIELRVEIANAIAWVLAVLFSFVMNKLVVFKSKTKNKKAVLKEFFSFVAARGAAFFVDEGIIIIGCNVLNWNTYVVKAISEVFVVVINYFFSKFVIFKKK